MLFWEYIYIYIYKISSALLLLLHIGLYEKIYMLREKNKIKLPFPRPSQLSAHGYPTPPASLECTPFEIVIDGRVNYFQ